LFKSTSALSEDINFRSSFDTAFPLPGNQQWTMLATVPSWLRNNVFEMLRGKRLALQLWMDPSGIATGRHGKRIAGCGLYQDAPGEIQVPPILTDRLLTFAVAVQEGQYGKGHQVQVQSVKFAL
jgi:hypothetical protein